MKELLKDTNKYFLLFGVSIILIIITGILSPIVIQHKIENWENELRDKLEFASESIISRFQERESETLQIISALKNDLVKTSSTQFLNQDFIISRINSPAYSKFGIQVYTNKMELFAWTMQENLERELLFPLQSELGESFFIDGGLLKYLTIVDTAAFNDDLYFIVVSCPVEKKYSLENNYFRELSFSQELSRELFTSVEIDYEKDAQRTKDGRKYSFELLNNFNNKIAVATILKPNRDVEINSTSANYDAFQSLLTLLSIFFLGMGFRGYLSKVQKPLLRFCIIGFYILAVRLTAFFFNIPTMFVEGELTNSAYFSSTFAWGLVRSPLEFFITVSSFLIISLLGYNQFLVSLKQRDSDERNKSNGKFLNMVIVFLVSAVYLLLLRGFGASIRSVIFDSSLRYFKDPTISLDLPMLLMHLNVLMLGFCSVIVSVVLVLIVESKKSNSSSRKLISFIGFFVFVQITAMLYDFFQNHPQGTPLIRILHILLVFILAYMILYANRRALFNHIFFALVASVISINLLFFYNADLEKESLKTTALELIRPNEGYLNFMVYETINNSLEDEVIRNALTKTKSNFEAASFILWSKSVLQREAVGSIINFYDAQMHKLGGFAFRSGIFFGSSTFIPVAEINGIIILNEDIPGSENKLIRGIAPIIIDGKISGYLEVSVLKEIDLKKFGDIPEFLSTNRTFFNSALDFSKMKIFDFRDGELKSFHADIVLTPREINQILDADFSSADEAWLNISLHNESHFIYVLKVMEDDTQRVVAVAKQYRDISWSLFDFFKVFFIHIIFILFLLIIVIAILYWQKKIIYISFRNKLLAAFLIISIIPLILLAFYFGQITTEKNISAVSYKLGKRAVSIEKYANDYLYNTSLNFHAIFKKAEKDLGVSFSLYDKEELLFSTEDIYYRLGLFPATINPIVFNMIYNSGDKEYVVTENVENYNFSSFYYQAKLGEEEYTIRVNDVFNKIILPLSDIEMDIFIFGTYSLAAILIIIISTIFANQISLPIIKLTKATKSVAGGDLNFELKENYSGEVKGLVDNFNIMIKQLKKSQSELAQMERETAWKEMAKQVAHEIKNPLTPMKLSIQQLIAAYKDKSPKFDNIFNRVTQTVISQIETLRNIASEFSSFARMPSLNVEVINSVEILNDAVNLFLEENADVRLISDSREILIVADPEQLKRTIINLIRNSLQAKALSVDIHVNQSDDECLIRVKDNGSGIPKEIVSKVFDEEFTTKIKGMGIGLSMAKRFISSVNGSIEVEDTSSNGTTILIIFPKAN